MEPITAPVPSHDIWRVHRAASEPFVPAPFRFSGAGRFDDATSSRFQVIYCAANPRAAFAESLAPFRELQHETDRARLATNDADDRHANDLVAGIATRFPGRRAILPDGWIASHRLARAGVSAQGRMLDVTRAETFAHLRNNGIIGDTPVDLSRMTSAERRLTQTVASWAYEQHDASNRPRFAGIRYVSRYDVTWICWAIFSDRITSLDNPTSLPIDLANRDLGVVAALYDLAIVP